jgi:hypothetical protein
MTQKKGALVPASARACDHFVEKLKPPPKPAPTAREKFLDEASWRRSRNPDTPDNRTRLFTDSNLVVSVFVSRRFPGRWGWVAHRGDERSVFSPGLFEDRQQAMVDAWERCKRRRENPPVKRPDCPVAPE